MVQSTSQYSTFSHVGGHDARTFGDYATTVTAYVIERGFREFDTLAMSVCHQIRASRYYRLGNETNNEMTILALCPVPLGYIILEYIIIRRTVGLS